MKKLQNFYLRRFLQKSLNLDWMASILTPLEQDVSKTKEKNSSSVLSKGMYIPFLTLKNWYIRSRQALPIALYREKRRGKAEVGWRIWYLRSLRGRESVLQSLSVWVDTVVVAGGNGIVELVVVPVGFSDPKFSESIPPRTIALLSATTLLPSLGSEKYTSLCIKFGPNYASRLINITTTTVPKGLHA